MEKLLVSYHDKKPAAAAALFAVTAFLCAACVAACVMTFVEMWDFLASHALGVVFLVMGIGYAGFMSVLPRLACFAASILVFAFLLSVAKRNIKSLAVPFIFLTVITGLRTAASFLLFIHSGSFQGLFALVRNPADFHYALPLIFAGVLITAKSLALFLTSLGLARLTGGEITDKKSAFAPTLAAVAATFVLGAFTAAAMAIFLGLAEMSASARMGGDYFYRVRSADGFFGRHFLLRLRPYAHPFHAAGERRARA